jgi:hypothetical protein
VLSGLYRFMPSADPGAEPWRAWTHELRLDVDGHFPQMTASGTIIAGVSQRRHWVANLTTDEEDLFRGVVWFVNGDQGFFPFDQVSIAAASGGTPEARSVTITYGTALEPPIIEAPFVSAHFHAVEFEHDAVEGVEPVPSVETCAHPNRPEGLPCEELTLDEVYRRAGFEVARSVDEDAAVPLTGAGVDERWDDAEMHDAMQAFWSQFTHAPQWALWVFWAALHRTGRSLGGVMFDDIGPNHRQGTAVFTDSFISDPEGDTNPDEWVRRMRFWTAAHEMGHAFNLAHAWQKALGTGWIPLANEPEARSFMNYPFRVQGDEQAFFADFRYRFSDGELLFMRHAPEQFVQMGNADWFDDHGFSQLERNTTGLRLEVRANRKKPVFEFLEPVRLELKLTNTGRAAVVLDRSTIDNADAVTLIVSRRGAAARQWHPYAQYSVEPNHEVLDRNESLYVALDPSSGLNGWDIAEPGGYTVQVALAVPGGTVVSNALSLTIGAPADRGEELLAQDVFTEDVGRTLGFGGSRFLGGANDVLREVVERFPDRRIAIHASYALARPEARSFKRLEFGDGPARFTSAAAAEGRLTTGGAKSAAADELDRTLLSDADAAAETLGHIGYERSVDELTAVYADKGDDRAAARCQSSMGKVFESRGVLKRVVDRIERRGARLAPKPRARKASSKSK